MPFTKTYYTSAEALDLISSAFPGENAVGNLQEIAFNGQLPTWVIDEKSGERFDVPPERWKEFWDGQKFIARPNHSWAWEKGDILEGRSYKGELRVDKICLDQLINENASPNNQIDKDSQSDATVSSPGRYSPTALRQWYEKRVTDLADSHSGRDDDWEAAKNNFGEGVPRDAVRALRAELAPATWTEPGRRKAGQN